MNLVHCSSDCLYQKEGLCAIGSAALMVRHTEESSPGGCVYFVQKKDDDKSKDSKLGGHERKTK